MPVVLCPIDEKTDRNIAIEPWNPLKDNKNNYDYINVMPIITPAFPSMNSAQQVHYNHMVIIMFELKRA